MELIHNGPRVPSSPDTQEAHRAAIEEAMRSGRPLAMAPTSPVLETFEPRALAYLLEQAIAGGRAKGQQKVRIDMTIEDAATLARYLQRAALAGVGV